MFRKPRRALFNLLIVIIILIPVVMFAAWLFTQKKPMHILILDKTVLTKKAPEHQSLNWILKHRKYVKPDNAYYHISEDYYGFFPQEDFQFEIHDLEGFSNRQIDSISQDYDMLYYTDTYGIFYNEWYLDVLQDEHSKKIYGGLGLNDYLLLQEMKQKQKLIVTEFNLIAHPTPRYIRDKVEALFGFQWTGWTLRYFRSLDTLLNSELPNWIIRNFKAQHNNRWPFKNSGIVFVHEDETIFILETLHHLNREVPVIYASDYGQEKYNLPPKFNYPYWIDLIRLPDSTNRIVASYRLDLTGAGDSLVRFYGIPPAFPAVIEHLDDYSFYYFAGDFCDNDVSSPTIYFRGITRLKRWFAERNNLEDRNVFFWNFYYPMMKAILNEYDAELEGQRKN